MSATYFSLCLCVLLAPSCLSHCSLSYSLICLPIHFTIFPSLLTFPFLFLWPFQSLNHIHPGSEPSPVHMWWEGAMEAANPPMLTTEILISNRGMVNIFINVPVRDIWLRDAFNICTGLLWKCAVHQFHMKLSFFFCSFLIKLASFQTPESEICKAFFFFGFVLFPHFAYEPF